MTKDIRKIDLMGGDAWTFKRLQACMSEYAIPALCVIHVGGHRGEEANYYDAAGFERVVYIEPDPCNTSHLKQLDPSLFTVHEVAIGDRPGYSTFYRSARSVGGSLDLHHTEQQDSEFTCMQLTGSYIQQQTSPRANVLVVDTQGTELEALKTFDLSRLSGVDMIIIEVRPDDVDLPAAPTTPTIEYLSEYGFAPVEYWNHHDYPCVDMVFVRVV